MISEHVFAVQFDILTVMQLTIHIFWDRRCVIGCVICDIRKKYSAFIFKSQAVLTCVINGVYVAQKENPYLPCLFVLLL